ncbi:hypothetical protein MMC25_001470 [Agyrium rufum]|nr:hypothetical protein [Agyrium rufum]
MCIVYTSILFNCGCKIRTDSKPLCITPCTLANPAQPNNVHPTYHQSGPSVAAASAAAADPDRPQRLDLCFFETNARRATISSLSFKKPNGFRGIVTSCPLHQPYGTWDPTLPANPYPQPDMKSLQEWMGKDGITRQPAASRFLEMIGIQYQPQHEIWTHMAGYYTTVMIVAEEDYVPEDGFQSGNVVVPILWET